MTENKNTVSRISPLIWVAIFTVVAAAAAVAAYYLFHYSLRASMAVGYRIVPFGLPISYLVIDHKIYGDVSGRKRTMLLIWLIAFAVIIWALGEFTYRFTENTSLLGAIYIGLYLLGIIGYQTVRNHTNFHKMD